MTDEKQPDLDEPFREFYFGDRPRHVAIWTPLSTRQRMAEEEAKRVAGLNWFWRWVERNCR